MLTPIALALLTTVIVLGLWKQGYSTREVALVSLGFVLVTIMLALGEPDVRHYESKVLVAALGGAVVQYGFGAYRQRKAGIRDRAERQ